MKYSKVQLAQEAIKHKGLLSKIPDLWRLIKAWRRGEYRPATKDIILPVAALLYLLSPIDLIPDFVIGVGIIDDLTVLGFAIPKIVKEIDKFLLWKATNGGSQIIDAEIVK